MGLNDGQSVVADNGSLLFMDGTVTMNTWCHAGGCGSGCMRGCCAGENCCINKFSGPGNVSFAYDLPGDTLPFLVTPERGWFLMRGAFVAGTENLNIGASFTGCNLCCASACCPGCIGLGAFFTRVTSQSDPGVVFASAYGQLKRHEVAEGQTLMIGGNNFFAAPDDTKFAVGFAGPGPKNWCCDGEGLVIKVMGPAIVFTHNRDETEIRALLFPSQMSDVIKIAGKVLKAVAESQQ
jgi:uncharacterized protein (AIM24 family)